MVANAIAGRKGFQSLPLSERFWQKVQKSDGCWLWQGSRRSRNPSRAYGEIHVKGRTRPAAQVSWELCHGRDFPAGMDALHSCDNPPCVNPAHIFPGTARDNAKDAEAKGRLVHYGNALRTVCKYGHPFSPENTEIRVTGHRTCRTCKARHNHSRRWNGHRYVPVSIARAALEVSR